MKDWRDPRHDSDRCLRRLFRLGAQNMAIGRIGCLAHVRRRFYQALKESLSAALSLIVKFAVSIAWKGKFGYSALPNASRFAKSERCGCIENSICDLLRIKKRAAKFR